MRIPGTAVAEYRKQDTRGGGSRPTKLVLPDFEILEISPSFEPTEIPYIQGYSHNSQPGEMGLPPDLLLREERLPAPAGSFFFWLSANLTRHSRLE
jgi:hypothetical protein